MVGVICHECAGVRACRFLSAKSHELFYGQMHTERERERERERESFIRSVTRGRLPSPLTDSHGVDFFASGQRARTQGAGRTALARALSPIV